MAVNIFLIHALGDAISPLLIGAFSDRFGLFRASLIAPAMMVASGLVLLRARRAGVPPDPQDTASDRRLSSACRS
jgi:hypothetical protein